MTGYEVCGIRIAATTTDAAAAGIVAAGGAHERPFQVHLCNTYTLSLVDSDPRLRSALRTADLNLPDGAPIAWLGRRHGIDGPVRGPGLVTAVMQAGLDAGLAHYLYGGADGVAEQMCSELERRLPGLRVVGAETPPYRALTDDDVAELAHRVRLAGTDVLWIGLGTPRQDHLVERLAAHLDCAIVPVGAAYDFISGRVPEAPGWLHGSGFEWLYRLYREPRRLWRRYCFGTAAFVRSYLRHRR